MFMGEIENLKISNSDAMFRKLSFFYELGGFFSPHLHALDYVLHQEVGFVNRYHVEDLKKIYKPHKIMKQIVSAFCILTGIKPKRKGKANGGVVVDYFSPFQNLLINKSSFLLFLRTINIYALKSEQVKKAMKSLRKLEESSGMEAIFNTNQGIFQIYLWIKSCISVQIILNPLNFISSDYIRGSFGLQEIRNIEMMYLCLEKWRSLYSIKLHCTKNVSSLRSIVQHCQQNYLDEESLNFIRIVRSGNKLPDIVLNTNKIQNEQSIIEFFSSFDLF